MPRPTDSYSTTYALANSPPLVNHTVANTTTGYKHALTVSHEEAQSLAALLLLAAGDDPHLKAIQRQLDAALQRIA